MTCFIANRLMQAENTKQKARNHAFSTFVNSLGYQELYIKRLINETVLTEHDIQLLEEFEEKQNLTIIILYGIQTYFFV